MINQAPLNPLSPTACTCTALRRASRSITRSYESAMKPSGINANQFTLLSYLIPTDGLPHGELAARLGLDRTTLTRNLQPLIREGYLREDGAQDQRVRLIVLTETGRKKRAEALPLWQDVQSRYVADLGEADWQTLSHLLAKIRPLEP